MATKRRTFCVDVYKFDFHRPMLAADDRRCGFTYKQAETVARRAFLTKDTSTAHVVTPSGSGVAICHRVQTYPSRKFKVECRKTGGHRRVVSTYRLAELVEGSPGYYL